MKQSMEVFLCFSHLFLSRYSHYHSPVWILAFSAAKHFLCHLYLFYQFLSAQKSYRRCFSWFNNEFSHILFYSLKLQLRRFRSLGRISSQKVWLSIGMSAQGGGGVTTLEALKERLDVAFGVMSGWQGGVQSKVGVNVRGVFQANWFWDIYILWPTRMFLGGSSEV